MRKGEIGIFIVMGVIIVSFIVINTYRQSLEKGEDKGIPFYSSASSDLNTKGSALYRRLGCRDCHTLWGIRNPMQAVPAPALDGIGSIRDEAWIYAYLSAENPQSILPSRLKQEYQMPSYSSLTDEELKTLSAYLGSLKVEDWYLEQARKSEYEKLTGNEYKTDRDASNE